MDEQYQNLIQREKERLQRQLYGEVEQCRTREEQEIEKYHRRRAIKYIIGGIASIFTGGIVIELKNYLPENFPKDAPTFAAGFCFMAGVAMLTTASSYYLVIKKLREEREKGNLEKEVEQRIEELNL